jgi:ribosomal protein S1
MKETGVLREADIARTFPVGSEVEVLVSEIDPSGRRIRLSRKAVLDEKEKDEIREYTERTSEAPAESFGSLAEKLRGAMRPKEN